MIRPKWWLRIVGVFYILQFVMMAIVKAPIRAQGPEGVLERAAAGDATALFVVDTWTTFGLEVGAIGAVLLIASRISSQSKTLIWAIIGIELARGIIDDVYMMFRGQNLAFLLVWIAIHTVVIVTGVLALRNLSAG